jgi:hypothetical protein
MKTLLPKHLIATFCFFLFTVAITSDALGQSKTAGKLKRADSFLGIHFDLHASEDITDAGKTLTTGMIDTFLRKVKPDFIQVDCKGHPGIASYPSTVGYHVQGFEKDPLKLFREVTNKHNIGLYVHYSGVMDEKVVKEHPSWAVINSNGEKHKQNISFFSPYLQSYLLPQLKELNDIYKIDGAWIDGDNWAVRPDYSEASLKRFTRETGITDIPKNPADKNYPEFVEYTRQLFREYLRTYIDSIHKYNPGFQITSNWAYSSMMPEKADINVDFLSGDLPPQNAVYTAALEARSLAPQGKPWDLMSWGFSWNWENNYRMPRSMKTAVQLKQEAAQVMAMGGGIQFYYYQNRDLSIKPWIGSTLAEVADFCRARQSFCHKSKPVPQIALLYPSDAFRRNSSAPFSRPGGNLQGALNAILDGQHCVELLMEHNLTGRMTQYPIIIIPECNYLAPAFRNELLDYIQNGGNVLLIGVATTRLFEKELGIVSLTDKSEEQLFIATPERIGGIRSIKTDVKLNPGSTVTSVFFTDNDFRLKGETVSSSVNSLGKGKIAAIYFNAGSSYFEYKSTVLRDFISNRINGLFAAPVVKLSGSHLAHVSLNTLNNRTYINLVNIAGEHTNTQALGYDEIPALKNLTVEIRTPSKPSRIILQPEGKELKFEYKNGVSKFLLPELNIHVILEVR